MSGQKEHIAIAATAKGVLEEIKVPTEAPGPGEVRIQVHYAALIAFDTYQLDRGYAVSDYPLALGFAGAGVVDEVGEGVTSLVVGDKVTAMTFPASKNKSVQEYSIVPYSAAAKIPDSLSLADAASISDNFITAFWTLFGPNLKFPIPAQFPAVTSPAGADQPVLVYGAGASSGQYIVQLLHISGFKKIFAVASERNHAHLRELGATHTFDYRNTGFVDEILAATGGEKVKIAIDTIAGRTSLAALAKIVGAGSKLAILMPVKEGDTVTNDVESEMVLGIPDHVREAFPGVELAPVGTFMFQTDQHIRENLTPKIIPDLLARGIIKPNKIRLLSDGPLKERVETGLDLLRNNKISGEKVIVQIKA